MPSFFRRKAAHAPAPAQLGVLGRLDANGEEWYPGHIAQPSSGTVGSYPPHAPPGSYSRPDHQQQQQEEELLRSPSPSIASVHSVRPSVGPPPSTTLSHPPRARGRRPSLHRRDSSSSIRGFVQDVGVRARDGLATVARRTSIDRRRADVDHLTSSHARLNSSSSTSINYLTPSRHPLASFARAAKSATDIRLTSRTLSPNPALAPPLPRPPPFASAPGVPPHSPSLCSHTQPSHPPTARRTLQKTARTSMDSLRKLGRKASLSKKTEPKSTNLAPTTSQSSLALRPSRSPTYSTSQVSLSLRTPSVSDSSHEPDTWGDPFAPDPIPPATKSPAEPYMGLTQPTSAPQPSPHSQNPQQLPRRPGSRPSTASHLPTATSTSSSARLLAHSQNSGNRPQAPSSASAPVSRVPLPAERESAHSSVTAASVSSASGRLMPLSASRTSNGAPGNGSGYSFTAVQPQGHMHHKSHGSSSVLSRSASGAGSLASSGSTTATTTVGTTSPRNNFLPSSARKLPPVSEPAHHSHVVSRAKERGMCIATSSSSVASVPRTTAQAPHSPMDNSYDGNPLPYPEPPLARAEHEHPRRVVGLGISGVNMDGTVVPSPQTEHEALNATPTEPDQQPLRLLHHSEPLEGEHNLGLEPDLPPVPVTPAKPPQLSLDGLDFGSDLGLDDWTPSWLESKPDSTSTAGPAKDPAPPTASSGTPRDEPVRSIPKAEPASRSNLVHDEGSSAALDVLEGLMSALAEDTLAPEAEDERSSRRDPDEDSTHSHTVVHSVTATVRSSAPTTDDGLTPLATEATWAPAAPSPSTVRAYSPPTPAARRSSSMRRSNCASARWSVGSGAKKKKVSPGDWEQHPLPSQNTAPAAQPGDAPALEEADETELGPSVLPSDLKHLGPYLSSARADALYTNLSIIGEGECGDVYCADTIAGSNLSTVKVAIKVVRRDSHAGRMRLAHLARELSLWKQVSSSYVLRLHHVLLPPTLQGVWLVQDLMDRSVADVLAAVDEGGTMMDWDETHVARVLYDTAMGLLHLHQSGILHRDCRSDNLLLGADGNTRLTDFTHATSLTRGKRQSVVGTPFWMAPEVILARPYGTEVDLWSLGAVLWELTQGEPPYIALPPREAVGQIVRRGLPPLSNADRWSGTLQDLLSILTQDAQARPTAQEVVKHNFFSSRAPNTAMVHLLEQAHAVERAQGDA